MKIFSKTLIAIIKIYQLVLSPYLGNNCRYLPTCSEYFVESLKEFGFGRNFYEFCADWVLNHDTTAGIKEAFKEYETQRPNQINQNST